MTHYPMLIKSTAWFLIVTYLARALYLRRETMLHPRHLVYAPLLLRQGTTDAFVCNKEASQS